MRVQMVDLPQGRREGGREGGWAGHLGRGIKLSQGKREGERAGSGGSKRMLLQVLGVRVISFPVFLSGFQSIVESPSRGGALLCVLHAVTSYTSVDLFAAYL